MSRLLDRLKGAALARGKPASPDAPPPLLARALRQAETARERARHAEQAAAQAEHAVAEEASRRFAAERDAIDAALARGEAESQALLESESVVPPTTPASQPPPRLRRATIAIAAVIAAAVVAWTWRPISAPRPAVFKMDQQLHLKGSEPFNEQKGDRSK